MKRAISSDFRRLGVLALAAGGLAVAFGCSAPTPQTPQGSVGTSSWVTTPMIQAAERTSQGLTLRGLAAPAGRVVVRGEAGVAYATGADDQGRFTLRIGAPTADTLFVVETQNGQDAAPAPYRLLVSRDSAGPIALLTPGGPSRRLDKAGPLDVIDGDGRSMLASGRASPGAVIPVVIDGAAPVGAHTGRDGRWVQSLEDGATTLAFADRTYVRPPLARTASSSPVTITVTTAGGAGGKLVTWATPGGSVQESWFPDAS